MTGHGRQRTEQAEPLRPLNFRPYLSVVWYRGFTLVEMAMVLVVIGLIILTVFPALNAVRMSSQRSATRSNLQALMLATAAYVQANGCLPCPTPATTTGTGFGRVAGSATAAACGACAVPEGIAPFMSLGIPASTAEDGWGRWITMRVDPALTNPVNLVAPPTVPSICACTLSGSQCVASASSPKGCSCAAPVNGVCVSSSTASVVGFCAPSGSGTGFLSKSNSVSVQTTGSNSQPAAVIFVSHGSNGYGSFLANALTISTGLNGCRTQFPSLAEGCPQALTCSAGTTGLGAAECNASGTTQFDDAPTQINGSSTYDDMLAYADRNTLVSMFGNGSCQTAW